MRKIIPILFIGAILVTLFFKSIFFTRNTFFQRDTLLLFHPWMNFSKELLKNGEIPLWNPFTNCGMPFLANFQSGVFYPLNIFFYLLSFVSAYKIYIFVHFLLTFLFMFLLLKDFELPDSACLGGSLIWTFSGTLITRVEFFSVLGTTIWLPLNFLLLRKSMYSKKYIAFLCITLPIQLLAGHPQEFFYSLLFLIGYTVFYSIDKKSLKPIFIFISVILMAFLLSAIQLLPSIELILNSRRVSIDINQAKIEGMDYDESTYLSLKLSDLKNIIYPFYYKEEVVKKALKEKILYIPHLWIKCHHIGIIGFICGIIGLFFVKKKIKWYLILAILFATMFSLGGNLPFYNLVYRFFLPSRFIRHPATVIYISIFCFSIFSAFGISYLKKDFFRALLSVIAFLELFSYGKNINLSLPSEIFVSRDSNINFLTSQKGFFRFTLTPLTLKITKTKGKNLFDSFVKYRDKLYGNVNMIYHLYNFYGQDIEIRNFYKFVDRVFSKPSLDSASKLLGLANVKYVLSYKELPTSNFELVHKNSFFIYKNKNFIERIRIVPKIKKMEESKILDYLDSKYFHPKNEVVVDNSVELTCNENNESSGKTKIEILKYSTNFLSLKTFTEKPSFLFIAETYYPGWKAYIDKKETKIFRGNYLFKVIELPKGEHTVDFVYKPVTFTIGKFCSLFSILFLSIFSVFVLTNQVRI